MEDVGDFVVSKQLVTCFTIIVFFFYIFITATGKKKEEIMYCTVPLKRKDWIASTCRPSSAGEVARCIPWAGQT